MGRSLTEEYLILGEFMRAILEIDVAEQEFDLKFLLGLPISRKDRGKVEVR
jgi:hypothetical protein